MSVDLTIQKIDRSKIKREEYEQAVSLINSENSTVSIHEGGSCFYAGHERCIANFFDGEIALNSSAANFLFLKYFAFRFHKAIPGVRVFDPQAMRVLDINEIEPDEVTLDRQSKTFASNTGYERIYTFERKILILQAFHLLFIGIFRH